MKVSCTPGLFWSIVRNRQVLPCISIPTRTDFENGSKKKTATLTVITRLRRFISQPHLPAILFAAGCALTLALALVGTTTLLLAYIAVVVLGLLAATVALWLRMALIIEENDLLGIPLALADDRQALDLHWSLAKSLQSISANHDPVYRDLALERTRQLDAEIGEIAHDRIVFTGTERWRMAYERLLQSRGLHLYRSVAVIRTAHYWQDEPGRQSMAVNFAAHKERFLNIERIAIVADSLWPVAERLPIEPLQTWLADQHTHGLSVRLVRLSELGREPDLVLDLGIYGTRAVGVQEQDDQGRTVRFTLSFDFAEVLAAEQRWERLSLLATSFEQILDQSCGCT